MTLPSSINSVTPQNGSSRVGYQKTGKINECSSVTRIFQMI